MMMSLVYVQMYITKKQLRVKRHSGTFLLILPAVFAAVVVVQTCFHEFGRIDTSIFWSIQIYTSFVESSELGWGGGLG